MRKHREVAVRSARRVAASAAVAALGITGLVGLASTAHADDDPSSSSVEFPADSLNTEAFNRIMHEPLDEFAQEEQTNNPTGSNDPIVDGNGIRWDTDGCSDPTGQFGGGDARIACERHDVAFRTLQQNDLWNADSMNDANRNFTDDLSGLQQGGRISETQEIALGAGAGVGSNLPSSVNGLPSYDGSTDSPFDDQAGDDGVFQPSEGAR
ncbi:hypothetical protein AQI88_30965 [Streptomyces cellostaticus]|uniref:Phospholipase n=1 Tax=Streptomyces cellostaticus TaxID=67285 RepID=A0A101NG00_9ACTN|nr:hypothetical protein [Streptomyces cellostaticus]KUM92593.1 hypothetical protein AQI88_30965 [Streptomyces cellostaticus]GHI10488.1 hypothetical protein Scel_88090 [Streptomyces cellostaticus]